VSDEILLPQLLKNPVVEMLTSINNDCLRSTKMMEIKSPLQGSRSSTNWAGYEARANKFKDVLNGLI
jgi:hypothetical protein